MKYVLRFKIPKMQITKEPRVNKPREQTPSPLSKMFMADIGDH